MAEGELPGNGLETSSQWNSVRILDSPLSPQTGERGTRQLVLLIGIERPYCNDGLGLSQRRSGERKGTAKI